MLFRSVPISNASNIQKLLILFFYTNQTIIKTFEANNKKNKRVPIDILLKQLEIIRDIFLLKKNILQEVHTLKEIIKKNYASINNKFTFLNHTFITIAILPTSISSVIKLTYAHKLKNALATLLTIFIKNLKIIIKLNYKDIFYKIQ